MRALNPFAAQWYTPINGGETRFKLRGMTGREQAEFLPDMKFEGDDVDIPGKTVVGILRACLEDWEKFDDAPDFNKSDPSMLDYVPYTTQVELVTQVMAQSFPDPASKKK